MLTTLAVLALAYTAQGTIKQGAEQLHAEPAARALGPGATPETLHVRSAPLTALKAEPHAKRAKHTKKDAKEAHASSATDAVPEPALPARLPESPLVAKQFPAVLPAEPAPADDASARAPAASTPLALNMDAAVALGDAAASEGAEVSAEAFERKLHECGQKEQQMQALVDELHKLHESMGGLAGKISAAKAATKAANRTFGDAGAGFAGGKRDLVGVFKASLRALQEHDFEVAYDAVELKMLTSSGLANLTDPTEELHKRAGALASARTELLKRRQEQASWEASLASLLKQTSLLNDEKAKASELVSAVCGSLTQLNEEATAA
jgi:hypothetical protein